MESRIVFGLNDEGWNVIPANIEQYPSEKEIQVILQDSEAKYFMLLVLNDWYVSINLNWVTAFSFDWDVSLKIFDSNTNLLLQQSFSGRDVVDEEAYVSSQAS